MSQTKKHISNIQHVQKIWQEHRSVVLSISFVLLVAILSTLGQSKWFKSSLLEVSHPFDGAIYPIEFSPDYTKWTGNVKTTRYENIEKKYLTQLPEYTDALKNIVEDQVSQYPKEHNAQLTYPVVYLGTYNYDHKEDEGSHLAVDIRVPEGTPVRNIAHGTVVKVDKKDSGFGHHLCIRHANVPDYKKSSSKTTLLSCYNHMDEIYVEEGEFILKGNIVGTSGNTGTSTTPHLHFQMDRIEAPWHPYWPFSWAEASAANLTFFDAVSEGLNKDKAKEFTVNPMLWIKDNYSEEGIGETLTASTTNTPLNTSSENTDQQEESKITKFLVSAEQDNFYTNETVSLTITALDENGETFKDFKPESTLEVSSNSNSAEFKKILRFINGKSKLEVSNTQAEDFEIQIKQGEAQGSILLISQEISSDNENEENNTEENLHGTSDTEEEKLFQEIGSVTFSGENYLLVGSSLQFYVEFKDTEGEDIQSLEKDIEIQVEGNGELNPSKIQSSDIQNGKVSLRYKTDTPEKAVITILNESFNIEAIEKAIEASAFELFTENNEFIAGGETELTIQAVDNKGNAAPNYFSNGTVTLSFAVGEGKIEPSKLSQSDFRQGKATVTLSIDKNIEYVKIEANNGIYSGKSKSLRAKEESEEIFIDVPNSHKNAEAIDYLKKNNIIGGYPDGSFKPTKEVSRIEALKMLLLGLNKGLSPAEIVNFPDTEVDAWYSEYIGRALTLEMVKGYPDGTFKPANTVNRAEYYKVLMTAAGVNVPEGSESPFEDVDEGTWFTDYVSFAKNNGITDAKTYFYPSGSVTRAEVAETLYRTLLYLEKE